MSTRATIEYNWQVHWYYEMSTEYNHGIEAQDDGSIVLEIPKEHMTDDGADDGVMEFVFPKGSDMYKLVETIIARGADKDRL